MKKIIILILCFICYNCEDSNNEVFRELQQSSSTRVSIETALKSAEAMFAMIDGPTTRVTARVPKQIEVVGTHGILTRSVPTKGLDSLFYIVNYENNEGFAILSADNRLIPVLGICNEGEFDSSDTDNPGVRMVLDNLSSKNYDLEFSNRLPDVKDYIFDGNPAIFGEELLAKYGPFGNHRKWGQRSPFNKYCFTSDGQQAPVGCVAVATALIMAHHKFPNSIMGYNLNWNEMDGVTSYSGSPQGVESVARLLSSLGNKSYLNMNYSVNNSGASSYLVPDVLRSFGYTVGKFEIYRPAGKLALYEARDRLINHFENHSTPVYMRGNTGIVDGKYVGGHAWIIDGLLQINTMILQSQLIIARYDYFYCNWGWNGTANGWYIWSTFDTANGPSKGELDENFSSSQSYFNTNVEMLLDISK